METHIINFLINILLPSSCKIPKEKLIKLLNILDIGCTIDYTLYNLNSSTMNSISRVCITHLFELSKLRVDENIKNGN